MPFFIEIGTCDFDTLIPLADNGWEGICVEPIKYYIDQLPKKENVHYENSCILPKKLIPENKQVDIQFWDFDFINSKGDDGSWMKGVSNTDLDRNTFNMNEQWMKHAKKIKVNALSLDELVDKYNVTEIEYIKIDIEGRDFEILQDYSFKVKPRLIKMESKFLEGRGFPHEMVKSFFEEKGYIVYFEKTDLYAIC